MPVRIAGRTEMVSLTTYNQLQSSNALAQNMTNLARRFDGNWRPEPSMVGNVAGQIAANQSTAAQAVRFIHQTNPDALPQASTMSIVAPQGNPVGFVAPRTAPNVRTLRTEPEMQMMIAQLLTGARPLSKPLHNGMPYLRPDGVIVTIRESQRNGVTIDLSFPGSREPLVKKFHFLQPKSKSFLWSPETKTMTVEYPFPAVRHVKLVDFNSDKTIEGRDLTRYCEEQVEDPSRAEAEDFSYYQKIFKNYFDGPKEIEAAMRYFLGYIMSRGYAPMNFANAVDLTHEYGPITKYGLRPQEIIDNLIADWRSRGCELFEPYEVMFGWEHDCGLFMEDDEEEPGT